MQIVGNTIVKHNAQGTDISCPNSAISLVIVVTCSVEHLQTIVVNVACFNEELGLLKTRLYSSVCIADK